MSPKTGDTIWMRCEVRPGPFSDERFVKAGDWLGFVRVEALYEPIETGEQYGTRTTHFFQGQRTPIPPRQA